MQKKLKREAVRIEFEGTDGAGKTTALKYFVDIARERGFSVLETREVGSPLIPINIKLRELVLSSDSNLCGEAMELIFAAMRFENDRYYAKVKDDYDFIVSDRGWFSHISYTDHNVNEKFTEDFYLNFLGKVTKKPDVVLFFNVDSAVALQRRESRGGVVDVIEAKGMEYQDKVKQSFFKYFLQGEDDNMIVNIIDANKNIKEVQARMDRALEEITESYGENND